jgi:hypothetical protein
MWLKVSGLGYYDFDDGFPPLITAWCDGEFKAECDYFRGMFPHCVTRMELAVQLAERRCAQ